MIRGRFGYNKLSTLTNNRQRRKYWILVCLDHLFFSRCSSEFPRLHYHSPHIGFFLTRPNNSQATSSKVYPIHNHNNGITIPITTAVLANRLFVAPFGNWIVCRCGKQSSRRRTRTRRRQPRVSSVSPCATATTDAAGNLNNHCTSNYW